MQRRVKMGECKPGCRQDAGSRILTLFEMSLDHLGTHVCLTRADACRQSPISPSPQLPPPMPPPPTSAGPAAAALPWRRRRRRRSRRTRRRGRRPPTWSSWPPRRTAWNTLGPPRCPRGRARQRRRPARPCRGKSPSCKGEQRHIINGLRADKSDSSPTSSDMSTAECSAMQCYCITGEGWTRTRTALAWKWQCLPSGLRSWTPGLPR